MNAGGRCLLACIFAAIGCQSASKIALRDAHQQSPPTAANSQAASSSVDQPASAASPSRLLPHTASNATSLLTSNEAAAGVHLTAYEPAASAPELKAPAATVERAPPMPALLKDSTEAELPAPNANDPTTDTVTLADVITAVYASYPSLDAVSRERQIAAAQQLAALGEFDLDLVGETINQPLAYYKNYRHGLGLKQYSWNGGQTFAGYRIGRGYFEPWYKERQTNDGGEFKAGFTLPFLRDRDIDKRRAAVFQAQIDQAAAEPLIQTEVIDTVQAASMTYWGWVAAGQRARIAQKALDLAVERQAGMEARAKRGDVAGIELVDNERLIVARQAKQVEANLKLRQAAIKLSLFLRDYNGTPLMASDQQLPADFPQIAPPALPSESELTSTALSKRPELRLLQLEMQRQELKVREASNLGLPALDGLLEASQDVGGPADPKRDKSPFELEAGLMLDVPLQRREARGKLQAAQAKLAQLSAKRRYLEQSIVAEVQSARAALEANFNALEKARRNAELAQQLADAERKKLDRGDSNVLTVNLRELATVEAELSVIDAEANYFSVEAQLHAALAEELTTGGSRLLPAANATN